MNGPTDPRDRRNALERLARRPRIRALARLTGIETRRRPINASTPPVAAPPEGTGGEREAGPGGSAAAGGGSAAGAGAAAPGEEGAGAPGAAAPRGAGAGAGRAARAGEAAGPGGTADAAARAPASGEPPGTRKTGKAATRRFLPAALGAGILLAATVGVLASVGVIGDEPEVTTAPAPVPVERPGTPEADDEVAAAAAELGFPAFATKNTTRIAGSDPASTAAAAALATYPSAGESPPPAAVAVADSASWQGALAAAVLAAEPVSAPVLLSAADRVPSATESAIAALDPPGLGGRGSAGDGAEGPDGETGELRGAQILAIGEPALPHGFEIASAATDAGGESDGSPPGSLAGAATLAANVARLRARLAGGPPEAYVAVSAAEPALAMPAAAWAARSGDPILYTGREQVPPATAEVLAESPDVPVYVLGPEEAVSEEVLQQLAGGERRVRRVGGADPVQSAIDFARYSDGRFGWNINDPGHGMVLARSDRVLDAVAAAPLAARGAWGPLLLTDRAEEPPQPLAAYLLDIKPGYRTDPTRAVYNHVWVIGDHRAIGLGQQATLDWLAELERIGDNGGQETEP